MSWWSIDLPKGWYCPPELGLTMAIQPTAIGGEQQQKAHLCRSKIQACIWTHATNYNTKQIGASGAYLPTEGGLLDNKSEQASKQQQQKRVFADLRSGPSVGFCSSYIWPKIGHIWPKIGHIWPKIKHILPQIGHILPKIGHIWPKIGHIWPKIGHIWPKNSKK